jgi:predicted nucleic acid-binding protein
VATGLILETTFLVDLERERRRLEHGPALRFLAAHGGAPLCITPTVAGELAVGDSLHDRSAWERFIAPFRMLPHDREVCWEFSKIYRHLKLNGQQIGSNDTWISAVAVAKRMALVTANVRHFERVPGLEIVGYR